MRINKKGLFFTAPFYHLIIKLFKNYSSIAASGAFFFTLAIPFSQLAFDL